MKYFVKGVRSKGASAFFTGTSDYRETVCALYEVIEFGGGKGREAPIIQFEIGDSFVDVFPDPEIVDRSV